MAVAFERQVLDEKILKSFTSVKRELNNDFNVAPEQKIRVLEKPLQKTRKKAKVSPKLVLILFTLSIVQSYVYYHSVQVESKANEMQNEIVTTSEINYKLQSKLSEIKELRTIESKAKKINMLSSRDSKYTYILIPEKISNADEKISPKVLNADKTLNNLVGY